MSSNNQERFIRKLRDRLMSGSKHPHPGRWHQREWTATAVRDAARDNQSPQFHEQHALITQFTSELAAVGGKADCCSDPAQLSAMLAQIGPATGIRTVTIEADSRWSMPAWTPWHDALRATTPHVIVAEDYNVGALAKADIGVTLANYGIAETGTVVLSTGPGRSRVVGLLPPVHLVLLPAANIKQTRNDVFTELHSADIQTDRPSYTVLITGPSRTADIEGDLTLGVHGPQKLYVLIV